MNVLRDDMGPGTGADVDDIDGELMTDLMSSATGVLGTGVTSGVGGGEGVGATTFFLSPAANRSRKGLFVLAGGVVSVGVVSVFVSSACNDVFTRGNTRFKGIRNAEQITITHKKSTMTCLIFFASVTRLIVIFVPVVKDSLLGDCLCRYCLTICTITTKRGRSLRPLC